MRQLIWWAAALLVAAGCGDTAATTTTAVPPTTTAAVTTTTPSAIPPETVPPTTAAATTTLATTTTAAPAPDFPEGALPELLVPDRFVDRSTGREDFDAEADVVAAGGDWYLLRSQAGSYLPVPAGWEVDDREDAADLTFGRLEDGGVEAFLQRDTEETDIAALLAEVQTDLDPEEGDELFLIEMIDDDRALLTGTSRDGDVLLYALAALTRRDGALHIFSAGTDSAVWAEFEPVVRVMVAGWHDLAGAPLGPKLPPDLGFPPPESRPSPDLPPECLALVAEVLVLLQGLVDQLADVTVEEWEAADEDVEEFVDFAAFDAAGEEIDARSVELGCNDFEDELSDMLESRLGELVPEGEVARLFLDLLVADAGQ